MTRERSFQPVPVEQLRSKKEQLIQATQVLKSREVTLGGLPKPPETRPSNPLFATVYDSMSKAYEVAQKKLQIIEKGRQRLLSRIESLDKLIPLEEDWSSLADSLQTYLASGLIQPEAVEKVQKELDSARGEVKSLFPLKTAGTQEPKDKKEALPLEAIVTVPPVANRDQVVPARPITGVVAPTISAQGEGTEIGNDQDRDSIGSEKRKRINPKDKFQHPESKDEVAGIVAKLLNGVYSLRDIDSSWSFDQISTHLYNQTGRLTYQGTYAATNAVNQFLNPRGEALICVVRNSEGKWEILSGKIRNSIEGRYYIASLKDLPADFYQPEPSVSTPGLTGSPENDDTSVFKPDPVVSTQGGTPQVSNVVTPQSRRSSAVPRPLRPSVTGKRLKEGIKRQRTSETATLKDGTVISEIPAAMIGRLQGKDKTTAVDYLTLAKEIYPDTPESEMYGRMIKLVYRVDKILADHKERLVRVYDPDKQERVSDFRFYIGSELSPRVEREDKPLTLVEIGTLALKLNRSYGEPISETVVGKKDTIAPFVFITPLIASFQNNPDLLRKISTPEQSVKDRRGFLALDELHKVLELNEAEFRQYSQQSGYNDVTVNFLNYCRDSRNRAYIHRFFEELYKDAVTPGDEHLPRVVLSSPENAFPRVQRSVMTDPTVSATRPATLSRLPVGTVIPLPRVVVATSQETAPQVPSGNGVQTKSQESSDSAKEFNRESVKASLEQYLRSFNARGMGAVQILVLVRDCGMSDITKIIELAKQMGITPIGHDDANRPNYSIADAALLAVRYFYAPGEINKATIQALRTEMGEISSRLEQEKNKQGTKESKTPHLDKRDSDARKVLTVIIKSLADSDIKTFSLTQISRIFHTLSQSKVKNMVEKHFVEGRWTNTREYTLEEVAAMAYYNHLKTNITSDIREDVETVIAEIMPTFRKPAST